MKRVFLCGLFGCVLLLSGCSMTEQGIPAKQLMANLYQIKFGDTSERVASLIGRPSRINAGSTASGGSTAEWIYTESQFRTPGQTFAVGVAGAGGTPVREVTLILTFTNNKLTAKRSQS